MLFVDSVTHPGLMCCTEDSADLVRHLCGDIYMHKHPFCETPNVKTVTSVPEIGFAAVPLHVVVTLEEFYYAVSVVPAVSPSEERAPN